MRARDHANYHSCRANSGKEKVVKRKESREKKLSLARDVFWDDFRVSTNFQTIKTSSYVKKQRKNGSLGVQRRTSSKDAVKNMSFRKC